MYLVRCSVYSTVQTVQFVRSTLHYAALYCAQPYGGGESVQYNRTLCTVGQNAVVKRSIMELNRLANVGEVEYDTVGTQ